MFNTIDIINMLKTKMTQNTRSYIIYPFGTNGRLVKDVLYDYFGVMPDYVVDEEWSKYNSGIIDFNELKRVYNGTQTVILTMEDREKNGILLGALQKFIPNDKIINLRDIKIYPAIDLGPNSLFPAFREVIHNRRMKGSGERVNVRFLFCNYSTFNTIESICEAFAVDERCDLLVILGHIHDNEDENKYVELLKKHGYKYIRIGDYRAEEDEPDILIVSQPFDYKTKIDNLKDYVKLVVVTSVMLISYAYSSNQFTDYLRKSFDRFNPDYYIFDSLLYHELEDKGCLNENMVEMGNAKFDGIWKAMQDKHYPEEWKKVVGKKVIVWGVDHGILKDGSLLRGFTFDIFAKPIFEWMSENLDIGMVFRPHDRLFAELVDLGVWTTTDLKNVVDYFKKSPNVILDLTSTYNTAFSIADGVIADATSGLSVSALATDKPLCLSYRSPDDCPIHAELSDSLYSAHCPEEAIEFMRMVKNGLDPQKGRRIEAKKKYIKNVDGNNGKRIKEFIMAKYYEKEIQ